MKNRSGWLPMPAFPPFMGLPVTAITFVALPAVPALPVGPPAFGLPARTCTPTPARKSVMVLLLTVALVMFAALVAVPDADERDRASPASRRRRCRESALFEMLASLIVPPQFSMSTPSASVWLITLLVIVTAPVRFGVAVRLSSNVMLFSSRRVARAGDRAVGEAEAADLSAVDAAVAGVQQPHVPERRARRVRQRDAVAGGALDRAAGVVAALRRVAAAGDGEPGRSRRCC